MKYRFFDAPAAIISCAYSTNNSVVEMGKKLDAFSLLPTGWHFGDGIALKLPVRQMAERIGAFGATYGLEMDAFPGVEGNCAVSFYSGERKLEVVVNSISSFTINAENGLGFDFVAAEPVHVTNLNDVQKILLDLSGRVWYSSDLFTQPTMMCESADSLAAPSQSPATPTKAVQTTLAESL